MTTTRTWVVHVAGAAITLLAATGVFAQEAAPAPSLAGVDQNHDGIRDDIKAFVEREIKAPAASPATSASATAASVVKTKLSLALPSDQKVTAPPPRRTCFDYLLLERKDRALANQHLQTSSQNGIFGTDPCDPFVSPSLDRPFDTDFAELRLGPARLRTSE